MVTAQLVKLALKRDPSAPVGQPAPLHVDCQCGTAVPITCGEVFTCAGCGTRYDRAGWMLHPEDEGR